MGAVQLAWRLWECQWVCDLVDGCAAVCLGRVGVCNALAKSVARPPGWNRWLGVVPFPQLNRSPSDRTGEACRRLDGAAAPAAGGNERRRPGDGNPVPCASTAYGDMRDSSSRTP